MSEEVDAAEDILRCVRPPVWEWKIEPDIRETASSDVEVPSRQEVLLENLDILTGSRGVPDDEVEELIELVEEWPEEQLEEIRSRLRELAGSVARTRGGL